VSNMYITRYIPEVQQKLVDANLDTHQIKLYQEAAGGTLVPFAMGLMGLSVKSSIKIDELKPHIQASAVAVALDAIAFILEKTYENPKNKDLMGQISNYMGSAEVFAFDKDAYMLFYDMDLEELGNCLFFEGLKNFNAVKKEDLDPVTFSVMIFTRIHILLLKRLKEFLNANFV